MTTSEIQHRADFSKVRYANCWEDADVLLAAANPEDKHCLSIGSAGDNSFSLLAAGAKSVHVVEMNPAQVACIKLRRAAYLCLDHAEFLALLGETTLPTVQRRALFQRCLPQLDAASIAYWNHHQNAIDKGFTRDGKFESYFTLFRNRVLPLVHKQRRIHDLLEPKSRADRARFYHSTWNTWRWKTLFRVFFSRFAMGRLAGDPAFFKYVEGSVADRILARTRHALIELDPATNSYLRWILTGHYGSSLPHALRQENFTTIRNNIDRLHIVEAPLESALPTLPRLDVCNLSDIFEYMSPENTEQLLAAIISNSNPNARLIYWNMLAPRSRPESLASQLVPLEQLASSLFLQDKAFFYSRLIIEEVQS